MFIDSQIGAPHQEIMMQRRMAISLISLLMLSVVSASGADVDSTSIVDKNLDDTDIRNAISQRNMFDGVKLTELQRQHMRDLMQQARQDAPVLQLDDIEKMYDLVTANQFDEPAVRKQITHMMQVQIERQVEMTRVRSQMYKLLTSEQKMILEQRNQQRMSEIQQRLSRMDSSLGHP